MTLIYPTLPGLTFSVQKKPLWSTKITTAASGRETRVALYQYPLWEFQLSYEFLRDDAAYNELRQLMGFYLQCQGAFGTFLFVDPDDCQAQAQPIGISDGTTLDYPLVRTLGGYVEPVGGVVNMGTVYYDGHAQIGNFTLNGPVLRLPASPQAGAVISADFQYGFLCRFKEDNLTFEKFMHQLWQAQQVTLVSVRA